MEIIAEKYLTARKEHFCDFCGKKITKGTLYFDQFNKEGGEVYHWKSCVECEFLFRELYDYMDPYDGTVDSDYFHESLRNFGRDFVCTHCDNYIDIGDPDDPPGRYMECKEDNCVECECYKKILKTLMDNEFVYERKYPFSEHSSSVLNPKIWKLKKRDTPISELPLRCK